MCDDGAAVISLKTFEERPSRASGPTCGQNRPNTGRLQIPRCGTRVVHDVTAQSVHADLQVLCLVERVDLAEPCRDRVHLLLRLFQRDAVTQRPPSARARPARSRRCSAAERPRHRRWSASPRPPAGRSGRAAVQSCLAAAACKIPAAIRSECCRRPEHRGCHGVSTRRDPHAAARYRATRGKEFAATDARASSKGKHCSWRKETV